MARSSRAKLRIVFAGVWLIGVTVYAYLYVTRRLASPDIVPGYESTWDFQLLMFVLFRLPVALLVLGLGWAVVGRCRKA